MLADAIQLAQPARTFLACQVVIAVVGMTFALVTDDLEFNAMEKEIKIGWLK